MGNTPLTESLLDLFHNKGNIHSVEKDTYLFQEDDPNNGTELTLRHITKYNLFGELSLLNDETTYVLNAKMIHAGEDIMFNENEMIEEIENKYLNAQEQLIVMVY